MTTHRPGAHERHLLRRQDSPLFPAASRQVDPVALTRARQRDTAERDAFGERFRGLLEEAAGLRPNEDSERLLRLKARLDQAYTLLASLGGDNASYKQALRRLTDILIVAIRRAAASDAVAVAELAQEQAAREQHYRLVEFPLVADLMRPESPIMPDELVATLLSVSCDELEAALWLFGPEELAPLCRDAALLLDTSGVERGRRNLAVMQSHLSSST